MFDSEYSTSSIRNTQTQSLIIILLCACVSGPVTHLKSLLGLKGRELPGGAVVKNPPANVGDARDVGSISGWEDPLEEELATHSSVLAWEIPGERSLLGYSIWGLKELDMTECELSITACFKPILHI